VKRKRIELREDEIFKTGKRRKKGVEKEDWRAAKTTPLSPI
jgi:hypothetical protein